MDTHLSVPHHHSSTWICAQGMSKLFYVCVLFFFNKKNENMNTRNTTDEFNLNTFNRLIFSRMGFINMIKSKNFFSLSKNSTFCTVCELM